MIWLFSAALLLGAAVILLGLKIAVMRRSIKEITSQLEDAVSVDTNSEMRISSSDSELRVLCAELSRRLKQLREEQLRFQNGDRELKEAITNISHDLRTPLTAIMGYLDVMERSPQNEENSRCLGIIRERAEAMKQLTEELFRYSVILSSEEGEKRELTDIGKALEDSLMSHYAALQAQGITPEVNICHEKITRELDPSGLSRVFGNLFGNAIKYSKGDLNVTLSQPCTITFSNQAPELTQVQVERLFDRFYTVEAARKSSGLGLSIAKTFVSRMGGSMTASLSEGVLTITVKL